MVAGVGAPAAVAAIGVLASLKQLQVLNLSCQCSAVGDAQWLVPKLISVYDTDVTQITE